MSIIAKMKEHFLSLDIPLSAMPLMNNSVTTAFDDNVGPGGEVLVCWLLDTRSMWPGENIFSAEGAAACMSLITLQEQNAISTKMFIADAKMSLGSALLKRLFITKTLGIPWKDVRLGRKGDKKHGKPCAVDEVGRPIEEIDFNVSHQNGLVTLIGWNGKTQQRYSPVGIDSILSNDFKRPQVMVGADIVCVNERDSAYNTIETEGFDGWVDIYDYVFSDEERWSMKYDVDSVTLLDGTTLSAHELGRHDRCIARHQSLTVTAASGRQVSFSSERLIEAKLRRFYTYFCYKEAYIKLAGEALLAPWLRDLEFHNVRSPKAGTIPRCSTHGVWGEEVDDVEVKLHGRPVNNVKMKIQAFEENFMLAVAIQGDVGDLDLPSFKKLDLQADILPFAEDSKAIFNNPVDLMTPWEARYF